MSIIDNTNSKMLTHLRNALKDAESIDILSAYFYFSGFNLLADLLKDIKMRILVGNTIDPELIQLFCKNVRLNPLESLNPYACKLYDTLINCDKYRKYVDGFIELFNKSELSVAFDETVAQHAFKIFVEKLANGTLEIKMTKQQDHSKVYIITNKHEHSMDGDQKGVVFMGSSNFTYSGLLGQSEINERFSDNEKHKGYSEIFNKKWNDEATVIINQKDSNTDFIDEIKKKLWIFSNPSPYHIFVRVLHELYGGMSSIEIDTPRKISDEKFMDLKYQIDAIKFGVDCLKKNSGVIIADVVGLGKTIVAACIAHNYHEHKIMVIAPPHLTDQWIEYCNDFKLTNADVYSNGKLDSINDIVSSIDKPILYIIDEAHRYRNEDTKTYQYLHRATNSNINNLVILLTATPYNNRPQDIYSLLKLFQIPSHSTLSNVDNLSNRFRELIVEYDRLERKWKKEQSAEIKYDLEKLANRLRGIIEPVILRRSHIDLLEIDEYTEDLHQQGIKFSVVADPELVEYDLLDMRDLYISTLKRLSEKFECVRYSAVTYLNDPIAFVKKYENILDIDINSYQTEIATFIKRLLVMRFESSKIAFRKSLEDMIISYENIIKLWDMGYVQISSVGDLQNPNDDDINETLEELEIGGNDFENIKKSKKQNTMFKKDLFRDAFIDDIRKDLDLLFEIRNEWFARVHADFDPKFDKVKQQLEILLKEVPDRKIVIFSYFADTARYVYEMLLAANIRALLFTGSTPGKYRNIVRENFDASYPQGQQKNEYDVIVATDALSEGFNLNRAGVIINYDIPYNPTRVVQRIGRINRINKRMFETIHIINFFPTDIGEKNTLIKGISTLKMLLINNVVGSDTKTLTKDETLASYFKKRYEEANFSYNGDVSKYNKYKNLYSKIKTNRGLIDKVCEIPQRTRIVRNGSDENITISFAKRGDNALFAIARRDQMLAEISAPENVLKYFEADVSEASFGLDSELDRKFSILADEICRPHTKFKFDKKRNTVISVLNYLIKTFKNQNDYLKDLIEIVKEYDGLCDYEMEAIIRSKMQRSQEKISDLKTLMPVEYIANIKNKADAVSSQTEIIMFTEDLRK
ncbi:MAG: phospholipase D-like domain-containing protein [Christensenellaceae bacterium]|jgi:superfamily II DNA or RNA helicase/HKD family nuclease|nr:phospholipase D-like domain-containing protein [Christensenellaceae bacterium]